jgi:hypothetical protein
MKNSVTDISRLEGVTSQEPSALRARGIQTIDDLWARIGEDTDLGIVECAQQTGISQDRLIDLLAAQSRHEAQQADLSWLRRHWIEVILVAIPVIVIVLALRALGVL